MNQIKKFLFDNFIIENDKIIENELPQLQEEVDVVADNNNENISTEAVFESLSVIEAEVEPEEIIVSYTQEELDKKVRIAEQNGYEKGYKTSQSEIENQTMGVLSDLNNKLMAIVANSECVQCESEKSYIVLAKDMLKKLIPSLLDEHAVEIVNKFIAENFKNFQNEAKLSFYIHPDIISCIQENIAKLANSHDFEGKIALHKDSKLGLSDCRVEWENGGVTKNAHKLIEKMDNLLDEENVSK